MRFKWFSIKMAKRIIMQHIGSAHNDAELEELMAIAQEWIKDYTKQLSVFPDESPNKTITPQSLYLYCVQYRYFYEQII